MSVRDIELYRDIRQIVHEEVRAALREHVGDLFQTDRGFDNLMEAINEPVDETDEMAAVLATLTDEEFETLMQKVKERKGE